MTWNRVRLWLAALAASAVLTTLAVSCQSGNPPKLDDAIWTKIPGATYVGEDTCAGCHEERAKNFQRSSHAHVMLSRAEDPKVKITCENCHGPGSKHVDAGGDPRLILKVAINNCFACHKDKRAEFSLQYHHPVKEGRMNCTACHDLHAPEAKVGTALRINDTCTKCHQEKAGPWTFEHEANKDGCIVCHSPHGSVTQKMLSEDMPNLCLKCHFGFEQYQRIGHYRHRAALNREPEDCTSCHHAVHGSNFSKEFRSE